MERHDLDRDIVVGLLAARERETSAEYIRHIAEGYKRPSYDFAKDLAALTDGAVTVEQIMDFPIEKVA
jgi:hypothetical protein